MNFRSSYYEKVGCKSVEEKKSLEILLRENPVNRLKLKQFCLRFFLPSRYRELIWCFILEIYPIYVDSKEYVLAQKKSSYNDLKNALKTMRYIDERTPQAKIFYAMYLLENRAAISNNLPSDCNFVKIAECLAGVFDEDNVETYFLTKKFFTITEEIEIELPKLIKVTYDLLEKHHKDLYNHLMTNDVLDKIPFDHYYPSLFTGIIADTALIRIFDRIIGGGSLKIVVFLFLVICDIQRHNIIKHTSEKSIIKFIETSVYNSNSEDKSAEKSDMVVNKAIDLWLINKNHKDLPAKYKNGD